METPIIETLIAKDGVAHMRYLKSLNALCLAIETKKVYNAEYKDIRDAVKSWGIARALDGFIQASRDALHKTYRFNNDIASYCEFNQAAGRVKRLSKLPTSPALETYIALLKEIATLNDTFAALKPYIIKGRKPNVTKTDAQIAEELRGTGICAICGRRQKMGDADKLVHHGYQMSEYNHAGRRMGRCFGTKYLPYELSCEANIAYKPILASRKNDIQETLFILKSGTVETISRTSLPHQSVASQVRRQPNGNLMTEFERELQSRIWENECGLRRIDAEIKTNDARIKAWEPQSLKYGR